MSAAQQPNHPPLTITTLTIPETLDGPNGELFMTYTEIWNELSRRDTGTEYFQTLPVDALARAQNDTDWVSRRFVGWLDGEIAALGVVQWAIRTDNSAYLNVGVLDGGDDVYDAMYAKLQEVIADAGRTVVDAWSENRPEPGASQLDAPTGFGSVPADSPDVKALLRNGYRLVQVERISAADPTGIEPTLTAMLDATLAKAGPDYAVEQWTTPTPDRFKPGYAAALQRVEMDIPHGDREIEVETIDVERVENKERREIAAGVTTLVTAVVHRPTGTIAAFNELAQPSVPTAACETGSTLVMPEHRGRRLGTIVKCAGLLRWREMFPLSPAVVTSNAEENRYMLDVNEAVGFQPIAYEGAFRKELA